MTEHSPNTCHLPSDSAKPSVLLLAAGHGKRMLPLTASTPKPLLQVGNKSLIEHHLTRLQNLGFEHVVINIAYLGSHLKTALGDGSDFGLTIEYSDETETGALETAGGIYQALNLIRSSFFIVINADIWTDYPFDKLALPPKDRRVLGKLVLVDNPDHNPEGDFSIDKSQKPALVTCDGDSKLTFSGIAQYRKSFFSDLKPGRQALAPLLYNAAAQSLLYAEHFNGTWSDIGTPERLAELNHSLQLKPRDLAQ